MPVTGQPLTLNLDVFELVTLFISIVRHRGPSVERPC